MIRQQRHKSATDAAALLLFTGGYVSEDSSASRPLWLFKDHQGNFQGPFSAANMLQWYSTQRLPQDLLVCGITAQTAQLPANAIPAQFFQPLCALITSTAAGMQYTPLSMSKAPVQAAPVPKAQPMPGAVQLQQAAIPQATSSIGSGAQMLMQVNNISNQPGQQVLIGVAGGTMLRQGVQQVAPQQVMQQQLAPSQQQQQQQQQVLMLQQQQQQQQAVQQQPQQRQFLQGMAGQQMLAAGQQQAAQRPVVMMQPATQYQQQIHVQSAQLPGQVIAHPTQQQQQQQQQVTQQLLLQQLQGGVTREQQAAAGGMAAPRNLQGHLPLQGVVLPQGVAAQMQGGVQQVVVPHAQSPQQQVVVAQQQQLAQQQQQQQAMPQQQIVTMQTKQVQALGGPTPVAATSQVSQDMIMGQQLVERQLQQMHASGRKTQFGTCTVAAQAKQYPGAETIQQRLQNVQPDGAGAAHVQQRLGHLPAGGHQAMLATGLPTSHGNAAMGQLMLAGQAQQQQETTSSGPAIVGASPATNIGPCPAPGVPQMQLNAVGHQQHGFPSSGPSSVGGLSSIPTAMHALGPHVPVLPARPGPASAGAVAATPRAMGMAASARLSGSSFNNLQQLAKQAAAGSVINGTEPGTAVALGASGVHMAAGPAGSRASADTLATLAAAAAAAAGAGGAPLTAPSAAAGPATTSNVPAASMMLGLAEGIDKAPQVPAVSASASAPTPAPTPAAACEGTPAVTGGAVDALEDVAAAIDDMLSGLVDDLERDAGSCRAPASTQAAQPRQPQVNTPTPSSTATMAPALAAATLTISSSALASGAITPEAVAAALPAVAAGTTIKAVSPLQVQTQAALAQGGAHANLLQNAAGQRPSDFLQQQLAQQRLQQQQQQQLQQQQVGQASIAPSSQQVLSVLGGAAAMHAGRHGTLLQGLGGAANTMLMQNMPAGLSPAQQQVLHQHQHLAQVQAQKQQQLLAQQQQQLLLQQQQQKLLAQAQAQQAQQHKQQQQQQQQKLLMQQQQLLSEQQQLQHQQQLREQLARLQQQQLRTEQQAQPQQLPAQQHLQENPQALPVPNIPQTQQIQQIQQGTLAVATNGLSVPAVEAAKPQGQRSQLHAQHELNSDALLQQLLQPIGQQQHQNSAQKQQGPTCPPMHQLLASTSSAGQGSQAAPVSDTPSSSAASASPRQFNPFGMSFMDPQVVVDRPKAQEQPLQQQKATVQATQPKQQQEKPPQQLSEQQQQEIMAALMPELAALGLSTDQQLEVLKKMLGLKQQQMQAHEGTAPQQQQQQPQPPQLLPQAPAVSAAPAAASQPAAAAAAAAQIAQPPPKPQHVWLQQLAAGKAAEDASKASVSAAADAGQPDSSGSHQQQAMQGAPDAAESGSDGEAEFDPSMLPADLFDFLDGQSSPQHLQAMLPDDEALLADTAVSAHAWPEDAPQGAVDEQQQGGNTEASDKPGKYVPPSLRHMPTGGAYDSGSKAGVGDRERHASSSSSSVQHSAQQAAGQQSGDRTSVGTYQPPHARERGTSPAPAGHASRTNSSSSCWPNDGPAALTLTEHEQRILEQQQRLPPHLRIVRPDAPRRSGGGDDTREGTWPPPPPPPVTLRSKQPDTTAGAAENSGSQIKHLLEKAAAAVHTSLLAPPVAPPPPPPARLAAWDHGPDRGREGYDDGTSSSYGRPQQRRPDVSPGFEEPSSHSGWGEHESDHPRCQHRSQQQHDWNEPPSHLHDEWYGASTPVARTGGFGTTPEHQAYDEGAQWGEQDSRKRGRPDGSAALHNEHQEYSVHVPHHDNWDSAAEPRFAPHYGSRLNPAAGAGTQWQRGSSGRTNSPPPRASSSSSIKHDDEGWAAAGSALADHTDWYDSQGYEEEGRYKPHRRSQHQQQDEVLYDGRAGRGSRLGLQADEWYEGAEDSSRANRQTAGAARPRRPSSREADADGGHRLTWQQKLLSDEQSSGAAGAGTTSTKPAWLAAATGGKEQEGSDVKRGRSSSDAVRQRERSPVDGRHGTDGMNKAPPAAPQPSQHLRAAAHIRVKHTGRDVSEVAHPPHQAPYGDYLKQLKAEGRQQHEEWPGYMEDEAWPSESPTTSPAAGPKEAVAAAMAAVQGLKPFSSVAPLRAGKAAARKAPAGGERGPTRAGPFTGVAGIQLPSVEETQAAVMAALGAGPVGPSRTNSLSSEQLPPQQDSGAFCRTGSSASAAGDGPDSREASLTNEHQQAVEAAGASVPRRSASLFSNVIGQLRKQATTSTTRTDSAGDMEPFSAAEASSASKASSAATDQAQRHTSRAHTTSYASAVSHSAAPPQPSPHLATAGSRRNGSDNAADIVLAAIQTTRQRAHAVSSRAQAKTVAGASVSLMTTVMAGQTLHGVT